MAETSPISRKADGTIEKTSWGELNWKITGETVSGAEMTYGTCRINPGERNPLHSHPNWARCVGPEPLLALIFFSSGMRTAVNHEGQGAA